MTRKIFRKMETNCKSSPIFSKTWFRTHFFSNVKVYSKLINSEHKLFLHYVTTLSISWRKIFILCHSDYLLHDRTFYISTMMNIRLILDVMGMTIKTCVIGLKTQYHQQLILLLRATYTFNSTSNERFGERFFFEQYNVFSLWKRESSFRSLEF